MVKVNFYHIKRDSIVPELFNGDYTEAEMTFCDFQGLYALYKVVITDGQNNIVGYAQWQAYQIYYDEDFEEKEFSSFEEAKSFLDNNYIMLWEL